MGTENHRATIRHLVQFIDKHGTARPQTFDNMAIMHDFMAHIDRGTKQLQCAFDNLDSTINTGTKTARICENNFNG